MASRPLGRKLTELQLAALACVRDNEVERHYRRFGYKRFVTYRAHGFDILCQVKALRKLHLIRYNYSGDKLLKLTSEGERVLALHPEY